MTKSILIALLGLGTSVCANADLWKWVDVYGEVHYVDTDTPIYTWLDEYGKVHYSDKPDHEDAVSVVLVWYSEERLTVAQKAKKQETAGTTAYPGETPEQRRERESAEAYYCKQAEEIYNSFLNAPRLYKTGESGQRVYLSDEEAAATLEETKARVAELCG